MHSRASTAATQKNPRQQNFETAQPPVVLNSPSCQLASHALRLNVVGRAPQPGMLDAHLPCARRAEGRSCPCPRRAFRHKTALMLPSVSRPSVRRRDAASTQLCILRAPRCCGEAHSCACVAISALSSIPRERASVTMHVARPRRFSDI